MKHFSIVAILFVYTQVVVYAKAPESKELEIPAKVTNKLVLNMLKNYQAVKSYHCLWQGEATQGKKQGKIELEVAFERKTRKTLFVMRVFQKKDKQWISSSGGQLHVYDGQKLQGAIAQMPGKVMFQDEQIVADPNKFTYRDFRKRIAFFYPFDLPLLFPDNTLTEYSLMEILQGRLEDIKTIEPDSKDLVQMSAVELITNSTSARMHLDHKTLLIKDFVYFNKTSGKTFGPKFKQIFVSINKPLKPKIFDFKAQVQSFNSGDSKRASRK
jgi:hypothetical protein